MQFLKRNENGISVAFNWCYRNRRKNFSDILRHDIDFEYIAKPSPWGDEVFVGTLCVGSANDPSLPEAWSPNLSDLFYCQIPVQNWEYSLWSAFYLLFQWLQIEAKVLQSFI